MKTCGFVSVRGCLLLVSLFLAIGWAHADPLTFTPIVIPGVPAANVVVGGINDLGQISGYYIDSSGTSHGFVRSASGVYTFFDPSGSYNTYAFGISNNGQVTGSYQSSSGTMGFVYTPAGINSFALPPGSNGGPFDINNQGELADGGDIDRIVVPPIGPPAMLLGPFTLPGAASPQAYGVNDSGVYTGSATVGALEEGFTWQGNTAAYFNDSSYTYTEGIAIADDGAIAGNAGDNLSQIAFVYQNGVFTDLLVPGTTNPTPEGINDSGDVVMLTQQGSFLGTPSPTPEPAPWLLLGTGLLGLGLVWRRSAFGTGS